MNRKKKFFIIFYIPIALFFCFLTGISDLFISLREECNLRDNIIPHMDLYPHSIALKSSDINNLTNKSYITYYMVEDSIDEVLGFYSQYGKCNNFSNYYTCFGKSQPFGIYTVNIRQNTESITQYDLEIRWDICPKSDGIEFVPIE